MFIGLMMTDMNLGVFVLYLVMFLPAELYLMYVNYLARVKYKEHFRETSKLWLWFDKKGFTFISLILHFVLTSGMMFIVLFFNFRFFAGLGCGVLWFNAIVDDRRLERKLLCIEKKCEKLELGKKCLDCAVLDEYDISLFPRKQIRKKNNKKEKG